MFVLDNDRNFYHHSITILFTAITNITLKITLKSAVYRLLLFTTITIKTPPVYRLTTKTPPCCSPQLPSKLLLFTDLPQKLLLAIHHITLKAPLTSSQLFIDLLPKLILFTAVH